VRSKDIEIVSQGEYFPVLGVVTTWRSTFAIAVWPCGNSFGERVVRRLASSTGWNSAGPPCQLPTDDFPRARQNADAHVVAEPEVPDQHESIRLARHVGCTHRRTSVPGAKGNAQHQYQRRLNSERVQCFFHRGITRLTNALFCTSLGQVNEHQVRSLISPMSTRTGDDRPFVERSGTRRSDDRVISYGRFQLWL